MSPQKFTSNHIAEPNWRSALGFSRVELTDSVRKWLLSVSSTSELIQLASGKPPSIHVVRQDWLCPSPGEAKALAISPRLPVLIREVEIYCNSEMWMLARTIVPKRSYQRLHHLNLFGGKALGQILFNDPTMRRSPFDFARLYGSEPGLSTALHWPETVWGRRSQFLLRNCPLLLSEVFLPKFQQWLEQQW